jgi:hypothetical protein
MLTNIPSPGDYILIKQDMNGPSGGNIWRWHNQAIITQPIDKRKYERLCHAIDLKAGEWYRVKGIRGTTRALVVDLYTDTKYKERRWVKDKIPLGRRLSRHWFRVDAMALNRNSECYANIDDLKKRLGTFKEAEKKAEQGRFSKLDE